MCVAEAWSGHWSLQVQGPSIWFFSVSLLDFLVLELYRAVIGRVSVLAHDVCSLGLLPTQRSVQPRQSLPAVLPGPGAVSVRES